MIDTESCCRILLEMICLPVGGLENMVDWLHICCIGDWMAVVGD